MQLLQRLFLRWSAALGIAERRFSSISRPQALQQAPDSFSKLDLSAEGYA
jgi:hypothetical protein